MMILNTPLRHRIAVAVFFFCCGCCFATWASRIPSVKDQFHFNEAELGGVLFMLPLVSFLALPFAGWAVAHYGSRVMTFLNDINFVNEGSKLLELLAKGLAIQGQADAR